MFSGFESIDIIKVVYQLNEYHTVASEPMSMQLSNLPHMQSIITHVDNSDGFRSISAINSKLKDSITPEELSSCLCIVIKTTALTLKATTHKFIYTTGFLTERFRTDKSHLRYNQLY